jgi:hypothetical protein
LDIETLAAHYGKTREACCQSFEPLVDRAALIDEWSGVRQLMHAKRSLPVHSAWEHALSKCVHFGLHQAHYGVEPTLHAVNVDSAK